MTLDQRATSTNHDLRPGERTVGKFVTLRDERGFTSRGQRGFTSRGQRGFTLIEIMVVLTIISILVAIAAVRYDRSMINAREAVLKQDLQALRGAIQQY